MCFSTSKAIRLSASTGSNIDGNEARANRKPRWLAPSQGHQQRRKPNRQYLVGQAVDIAQRFHDRRTKLIEPIWGSVIDSGQLLIDPAYEVAFCDIAHEKKQAVGRLIESTVAQQMAGRGRASRWLGSEQVSVAFAYWQS
jgi:hypothetical protein